MVEKKNARPREIMLDVLKHCCGKSQAMGAFVVSHECLRYLAGSNDDGAEHWVPNMDQLK